MLDYYFTRFLGDFKCDTRAMLNDRVHIWISYMLLYSWKFLPNSVHCHWLLWGHMTYISNNETVPCQNIWEGNIAKSLMSEGNSAPSQCFPQLCLGKHWDSWETKLAVFPGFSFLSVYCQATDNYESWFIHNCENRPFLLIIYAFARKIFALNAATMINRPGSMNFLQTL